jgi:hypothetical protein
MHAHFCPLEMITIDESMIQWYGIGGHQINAGLPNYVEIDFQTLLFLWGGADGNLSVSKLCGNWL